MNPYLVLGVPQDADNAAIRQAYLAALKLAPPDLQPKRFQAINAAYEQIKDEIGRYRYLLSNKTAPGNSPLDVVVRYTQLNSPPKPMPFEAMKEFLRACSKT